MFEYINSVSPLSVSAIPFFLLASSLPHCTSEADAFDVMLQITHLAFHQYFICPSLAMLSVAL